MEVLFVVRRYGHLRKVFRVERGSGVMSGLTVVNRNGQLVVDSREVARMVGKRHDHLLRDINGYVDIISNSTAPNFGVSDFFIHHSYQDSTGRTLPCYLITRKGCDMVANKMTGEKGVLFTAAYVTKFDEMEKTINAKNKQLINPEIKRREIEAKYNNSLVRKANAIRKIAEDPSIPKEYKHILNAKAIEVLTGQSLLPLPEAEKTYTAAEIADELGITANMVGRIANKYGLKTDEYAVQVWDKSPYSAKQISAWRYKESGKAKIIELYRQEGF